MSSLQLRWVFILLLIGLGTAVDVPFIFDESSSNAASLTSDQLQGKSTSSPELAGVPAISAPHEGEVIEISETGGGGGTVGTMKRTVDELSNIFDDRANYNDTFVRHKALVIVSNFSGDHTIDQICAIYNYLKKGAGSVKEWSYVADPRGEDLYQYASETLKVGEEVGCVGAGDCDDFAILISALIESIGGTSRIVLAYNKSEGHAYAEVYLGRLGDSDRQVERIIEWLKQEYNTDKIYTHVDTTTKEVWLNLDWGPEDRSGIKLFHPGGPFFQGDKHIVIRIREKTRKTFLKVPEGHELVIPEGEKKAGTRLSLENKGKILFDESHHQFWTACADSALIDYANELRNSGYEVDILNAGPITYSKLKEYNVLAFPNGFVGKNDLDEGVKLLSNDEIAAIKQFVQEGGGLALFECGWSWPQYTGLSIDNAPINQLGKIFGITLNDDIIHDPTNHYPGLPDNCPIFHKPFIIDHLITRDVQTISNCEGIPSSLSIVNPNAEILITGDEDAYSEKYLGGQKPPFMAAVTYGNGKVVMFGQVGFFTSLDGNNDGIKNIYEFDNNKLGLNLMQWLSTSSNS